jgi:hypothetical protein
LQILDDDPELVFANIQKYHELISIFLHEEHHLLFVQVPLLAVEFSGVPEGTKKFGARKRY